MTQKVSLHPKGITTIFRLKVYKSVMISLVEIYEKIEKSSIQLFYKALIQIFREAAPYDSDFIYQALHENDKKTSFLYDLFIIRTGQSRKYVKKGPFLIEGLRKGFLFSQGGTYKKGRLDYWAEPLRLELWQPLPSLGLTGACHQTNFNSQPGLQLPVRLSAYNTIFSLQ